MSDPWEAVEVYPQRHWYLTRPDGVMFNFGGYETSAREAAAALNALAGMNPEKLGELIEAIEKFIKLESSDSGENSDDEYHAMIDALDALRETE